MVPVADDANPGFLFAFWNVENFFEAKRAKCSGIAKALFLMEDAYGSFPDLTGLAEVGDRKVLELLVGTTGLRRKGLGIIHYDSPDKRGIDCALLYRRSRFRPLFSKPCHLYDSLGKVLPTRDILLAVLRDSLTFDTIAVMVNHHPSKIGKGSGERRETAMKRLLSLRDSLILGGVGRIVAVGDFNDCVTAAEGVTAMHGEGEGTIRFQGKWEKIDGCPVLEGFKAMEYIFAHPLLLEPDRTYFGMKPRRSHIGPRYNGGLSDHLPIVLKIRNK